MRTVKVLTTATVALTGCLGHGDEETEGARHSGFFFVRREAQTCVTETECQRYTVAPVNGGLARCAEDRVSSSCPVGSLDLSSVGLSPQQEQVLRASVSSSLASPTVVLHGTLQGQRFVATEAWRAPSERIVFGTVFEVMGAGNRLIQHRINTATEPTYIRAVDTNSMGSMSPSLRAKVLSDAAGTEGVVVAGTTGYDAEGHRIVRAEQVFVRAATFDAP